MAKINRVAEGTLRFAKKKPTKSERNRPGRAKRKPYRGQGKP